MRLATAAAKPAPAAEVENLPHHGQPSPIYQNGGEQNDPLLVETDSVGASRPGQLLRWHALSSSGSQGRATQQSALMRSGRQGSVYLTAMVKPAFASQRWPDSNCTHRSTRRVEYRQPAQRKTCRSRPDVNTSPEREVAAASAEVGPVAFRCTLVRNHNINLSVPVRSSLCPCLSFDGGTRVAKCEKRPRHDYEEAVVAYRAGAAGSCVKLEEALVKSTEHWPSAQ
ncbi:hypothetical protein FQR65_LT20076 [Abscondita terminalis]|nr:hypothetical protein FQR65_LT20076 [Abscondita terminalis]